MAAIKAGRIGEPFSMVVESGKIREFARAVKTANPAYLDPADEAAVIPPTFLQAAAFWEGASSSPLSADEWDFERVLHGEQEFVFPGPPPRAGDRLTVQHRIESVSEKTGKKGGTMSFVVDVAEYRSPAGKLVAESRMTLIFTEQSTTSGKGAS